MTNRSAPDAHPPVRDLFLRVWDEDPLRCPMCRKALIDDPGVVEKILRHLRVWPDPPPRPPLRRPAGVLAYRLGRGFREPYRQSEMSQAEAYYL